MQRMFAGLRSIEIDLSRLSDAAYAEVVAQIEEQQNEIRDTFKRAREMRGDFRPPAPSAHADYLPTTYDAEVERPTSQ